MSEGRIHRDTKRAFRALLVVSILLHLVLTPVASMFGLFEQWLTRSKSKDNTPLEQLKEIPIELFEEPEQDTPPSQPNLPKDDPVALIEQLDGLPVRPEAAPQPSAPALEPTKTKDKAAPASASTSDAVSSAPVSEPSSGAVTSGAVASATSQAVASAPQAGSAESTSSSAPPMASGSAPVPKPDPAIDNPIALAGKGAKLVEKNTSVGLILYMDRIRGHALGKRVEQILPALPQWNDFFGTASVNPVRDFERMFLLGPSFVDSSGLVMAIDHRVAPDKMRGAVNELVKKRGHWLTGTKVPAALTYADRAERVVLLTSPRSVMVIPPHLQEQALKQGETHIPKAKGEEAMVASVSNPAKALRRFGLEVPASLKLVKLRITPLSKGEVLLELDAQDESESAAQLTAVELTRNINATLDVIRGASGLLGRFGFGGLAAAADLPAVKLRADGKWVRSSQVLTEAQVTFILDRLERQLLLSRPSPAAKAAPAASNRPTPAPRAPAPRATTAP